MSFLRTQINILCAKQNQIFYILQKQQFLNISTSAIFWVNKTERNVISETIDLKTLINKYKHNLLYNSVLDIKKIKVGYKRNNEKVHFRTARYHEKLKYGLASIEPLPLSLKYICNDELVDKEISQDEDELTSESPTQFPYNVNKSSNVINAYEVINTEESTNDEYSSIRDEIQQRNTLYKIAGNWMTAYDNFENDLVNNNELNSEVNYGTSDPNSQISDVPCGGCGALLHCKDTGIPGYIPSEIFKNSWKKGGASLQSIVCQRCYFLKEYNLALQVNISAHDYPKILTGIKGKKALVVLMVDLMDFPCSIWPGIADILGPKTPIVVVGNKVDLLPKDGSHFFDHVKQNLLEHIKLSGFATCNILHTALISAKTGFGVEDLITSLQSIWRHKGDIYLMGCTNVGKSSLFNTLLKSDYCKVQASDLIQRATISQWPGTTLNMLKFPILSPSGVRRYQRHQRMMQHKYLTAEENRLKRKNLKLNNTAEYVTLMDRIDQTYLKTVEEDNEKSDIFSVKGHANASGKVKMGIDENHPEYAMSRWCFDTPGVVQPDQIIHLLTVEELMNTLPKQLITPETFLVRPGTSLFIAGLARLDFLEGPGSVRLTVFRSNELPVTICPLEEADTIYQNFLGTELFKVPVQGTDRLTKWPGLQSTAPFTVTGHNPNISCTDIVLSSAGWIAINCLTNQNYKFQGWTPEKRGIFIRDCILPKAVTLRGSKIRHSVAYKKHKFIV